MPDNFLIAAERMYDSSKVLSDSNHHHNACYLAGYVGECYLKILIDCIISLGPPNIIGAPRSFSHNINAMHTRIGAIASSVGSPRLRHYIIDMAVDCPNILGWRPELRYDDTTTWDNLAINQEFQKEQKKCFDQITAMFVSGLIS